MADTFPLTFLRAEAYAEAAADRGKVAFVAVIPQENLAGINGALGLAIANELGYFPVPLGWARYTSFDAAANHADILNNHLGHDDGTAFEIICSTMGGKPFREKPAT